MDKNIDKLKYKNSNSIKNINKQNLKFYLNTTIKSWILLIIIFLTFKDFFYFHHGNPFISWYDFYYGFLWWWIIWFTEWITTLNFIICIAFFVINLMWFFKNKINYSKKYTFFKIFNTVYMLYMFLVYNLLLLFYSKAITDYNPVTHKITNASVIEHIINPILWFIFCILDDKFVKFNIFNNNFAKIKYSLLRSLYILIFIFAYLIFTEMRNYLIHIGKWHFASREAYIYLDIYKIGIWKVMMYTMIGFFTFFILSNSLFLFYLYKENIFKKIQKRIKKNKNNIVENKIKN